MPGESGNLAVPEVHRRRASGDREPAAEVRSLLEACEAEERLTALRW
jgi:hypothetical protein